MTTSDPHPRAIPRHVSWHARSQTWHVRIQTGPHAGSYGYYYDLDAAEQTAQAAARGELTPGTRTNPIRITDKRPRHSVAKPINVRTDASTRSSTGVRGVSWNSQFGKYHVRIRVDGRYASFGLYNDLDDAAEVARQVYAGERRPRTRMTTPPHESRRSRPMTDLALERARRAAAGE